MSKQNYYDSGDWNAVCDICGFSFKFKQLKKMWNGLYADSACWSPRQPQDFVRGVKDNPSVPVSRPYSIDWAAGYCCISGRTPICDWAQADCATCG